ncbi:putative serine/threonine-protein kinase sis8 [Trifolium repens]|nr:putative serine/threonine-protein kinase sis8 [Trifolium repens]
MKKILKKLNIMSNKSENAQGSYSKRFVSSSWLHSVANRKSLSSTSLNQGKFERMEPSDTVRSVDLDVVSDSDRRDSGYRATASRDPKVEEEEYQLQLALEMSAKEDPEAVQIEAVKEISLGSCAPNDTPAEILAYRYWNYNALGYDDKVMDGFYDLYGILTESNTATMPSLIDLQGRSISGNVTWEAVLVNRAADSNLLKLEQKALELTVKSRSDSEVVKDIDLVRKLALFVADYMGGPVGNPESMSKAWRSLSYSLQSTLGSMILPLGSLTIGLARHRALLFKVLADSLSIPSRLVKGKQYTGSDDAAINFVKIDDGREYIVDLMADPGTLIPSDATGSCIEYDESFFAASSSSRDLDSSRVASYSSGVGSSSEETSDFGMSNIENRSKQHNVKKIVEQEAQGRPNHRYVHARSSSWSEGISSSVAIRMKAKKVSQFMIDTAKENPHLAQKLHDVLLESGVVPPPNLFSDNYHEEFVSSTEEKNVQKQGSEHQEVEFDDNLGPSMPVEGLGTNLPLHTQVKYGRKVPVSAAAAAAAAVVASSMVVAAVRSNTDSNIELSVSAAAAATAAAVVATTSAVSMYEHSSRSDGDTESSGTNFEVERRSGSSVVSNDSIKSDCSSLDDVAEHEIHWEEITLGERIGLGSYGEVYRGEWRGTEVAVKRFLNQDISGEALEEFISEVRIMKRLRHPNVVLFMGAVIRFPNLSIVTEFLPRGSLYRLIHRPNNQLDERRLLRMALDTARGMNYLHNCSPVIVHRDLKSPNLLVDKNWVVKVCDFGLSRMKHSTFLSSRSTAGTAEWMAPEMLRNEPSNEKCDVYSFGIILWELFTLQQPWRGMNSMQVVGAVGFQHRRLDIPDDMSPAIADIVRRCWQTDSKLRPTFAEILAALKPLQKPIVGSQVPRPVASGRHGKVQSSAAER